MISRHHLAYLLLLLSAGCSLNSFCSSSSHVKRFVCVFFQHWKMSIFFNFSQVSDLSIFLMLPPFDGTSNGLMVRWEVFNQLFQDFNKTSAQVINIAQPKKTFLKTIQYTIKMFFFLLKWDVFVVCLMPNAYCRWQNTAINSGARLLLNFPHISPKLSFRN